MLFSNKSGKKILSCVLYIFIFSFLFISNVYAQHNNKSTVKVGYYLSENFQDRSQNGNQKKGYAYEYYRKLSEYTGWQYEYVYGTYEEIYNQFVKGEIDLIAGLLYQKQAKTDFFYPNQSMGNINYSIIIRDVLDDKDKITPALLNDKVIGVFNGNMESILNNWLFDNNVRSNSVIYQSSEQLRNDFENRKLDAIIFEGANKYYHDEGLITISGKNDFYLCVSKNRPDLLQTLNEVQKEIIQEEPYFIENLRSKYFPKTNISQNFNKTELEFIQKHNVIRLGYLNNYLPYSDTDKNGNVTGIIKDLVPQFLEQLDLTDFFNITYIPFDNHNEMLKQLVAGNLDAMFPVGGSLYYAEESGIYKSNPIIKTNVSLIYKKNVVRKQLPVFAINRNNAMQENFVRTSFPEVEIAYFDSIEACLDAIKKGDADCTTMNGLRVDNMLKNSKYDSLESTMLPLLDERCFGVRVGNEGLLRILNRGLNCIGDQYVLNTAYQYTTMLFKYSFVDFIKANIIVLIIAIICVVSVVFHFLANDNRKKEAFIQRETKKNEELKALHREQETQLIEIKLLNSALEQSRKNIEKYINDMLRYSSSGDDPEEVLNQLLDYLGRNTGGDRIYIFEINEKGNYANTYEWCKKGITAQIDNLQDVPAEVIDHWLQLFHQSKAVIINDLEKDKIAYPMLYDVLKPQGINTLVAIPIIINHEIIGLLGVDNPPKKSMQNISEFLFLVEFIFSQMIRMRNNTRAIKESAFHDQLTGCKNRKALVEAYNKNFDEEQSCFVVACDMNGLKQVNDNQGHEAGDKFICRTADTLGDIFGPENVYRMGGDEFTIILFGKTKQEYSEYIETCKVQIGTTASIGSTYIEKMTLSLDDIMRQADIAMYKEKDLFYQKKRVRRNQI